MANRIVDIVLFGLDTELPMLLARMEYLKDVIDLTVILEPNITHSDCDRELTLAPLLALEEGERDKRFDDYNILYYPVLDLPRGGSNWDRVINHRNASRKLVGGIESFFEKGDNILVMTSDLDEIPLVHLVKELKEVSTARATEWVWQILKGQVCAFAGEMYYYHPLFFSKAPWRGPRVSTLETLWYRTPHGMREGVDFDIPLPFSQLPNIGNPEAEDPEIGAIHFSYMGGAGAVQNKIRGIAESNDYGEKFSSLKDIEERILLGKDPYDRHDQTFYVLKEHRKSVPQIFIERFSL